MKHGRKEKRKATATPSGKKSSSKAGTKSKASPGVSVKKSSSKAAPTGGKSNGKGRGDTISFNNPVVANAFRRAVKKFPTAFRRLTD
jgi:hypothetical protein